MRRFKWVALVALGLLGMEGGTMTRTQLAASEPPPRSPAPVMAVPPLPQGVTSFGAVRSGRELWIYGGNHGGAHQYWNEGQSNELLRWSPESPQAWQVTAVGPRLQGLALVAHGAVVYRVGGMEARNAQGDAQDLWSVADFARYNVAENRWDELPPLPEPRSSHDALVVGDRLYVVGGWTLRGAAEAVWLDTAYALDLTRMPLRWEPLPRAPFRRRALSLGHHRGQLYVLGGMQQEGGPTRDVAVLDLALRTWSVGPALIGDEPMEGFGSAAAEVGDNLYVSTYSGQLQQLSADGAAWHVVRKLQHDRFFHRLLPLDPRHLVSVGGASMSTGKFLEVEVIPLEDPAAARRTP